MMKVRIWVDHCHIRRRPEGVDLLKALFMSTEKFCQSCSMPLDSKHVLGTEKDGSGSLEYCKYCYKDGAFIAPGMTLAGMEYRVRTQMAKMDLPADLVKLALDRLPFLKRWSGAAAQKNIGPVAGSVRGNERLNDLL